VTNVARPPSPTPFGAKASRCPMIFPARKPSPSSISRTACHRRRSGPHAACRLTGHSARRHCFSSPWTAGSNCGRKTRATTRYSRGADVRAGNPLLAAPSTQVAEGASVRATLTRNGSRAQPLAVTVTNTTHGAVVRSDRTDVRCDGDDSCGSSMARSTCGRCATWSWTDPSRLR